MKIAIFTDTFFPEVNGVAKTLKRYTDYLTKEQIEFRVFAPESTEKEFFSTHVHRFTSFPFFLYPECRLALPKTSQVKEELIRFKPDIIHVATPFNMGLCGLHYAKKLNIPIVGSYHTDFDKYLEYYDLQLFSKLLWKYMGWFHRPLEKIFVPSIQTEEHLTKKGFTRLAIWPRGVDSTVFHPLFNEQEVRGKYNIKEKYILLYVGRLAPEKDVLLLPEIAENLPPEIKQNSHWLVVGDGPLKEELKKLAPKNMTFTGFLKGEELAAVYASANVFVFPSTTETFGNVVLEALACGTPTIAANAGGVRSIVKEGITGFLCIEKDTNEFVEKITYFLKNEAIMYNMSQKARQYALTQSWDSIFDNLVMEYEEVLKSIALQHLA